MPSGKPKAPKNCFWRGPVLWGCFILAGRKHRFSLHTDDPELAARRFAGYRERAIAQAKWGEHRPTWQDAVLAWAEHITASAKPSTVKRYAVSIKQLEPHLAGCYLDEIDQGRITEIVRQRRAQGRPNATIRRDLTAVSSVIEVAIEEGWRQDNPALARLKRLKERRDPITLPQPAHIEKVIDSAPGLFAALIRVAWLTGCRQNELVTLERRHLDFSRRQISLERTKTDRPRVIDMGGAYDVLRALPVNLACPYVFWHSDGRPFANVAARFALYVNRTQRSTQGFRRFRFHDLRHAFAVGYLKDGGNIYALQQHLGHSSITTTEIYLAHLTHDEAAIAKGSQTTNSTTDITVQGGKIVQFQRDS